MTPQPNETQALADRVPHAHARLCIDICALSETWLSGTGSTREGHYTFLWSGYPDD